ncbi:MAG: LacI family DNA-binding transcriptional regulator [Victivallales bacterium]|nr:LacI family DNA-binding transcriptional regulator [Victivallales bacterium]
MTSGKFQDLVFHIDVEDKENPIYIQIKRQVLRYAQEHHFRQNDPMPDITTIATAAGVSLRTANQAMESLSTDGYCYRRRKRGSFYMEPSRSIRRMCAVFLSRQGLMNDEIEMEYYKGLYSYGMEHEIDVATIQGSRTEAFQFYNTLERVELCGMAVLNEFVGDSILELAKQYPKKRIVFLCPRLDNLLGHLPHNCHIILNDDFDGGYRLAEYYASLGCQSMAILSMELPENDGSYRRRVKGFTAAASKYGIAFQPQHDLLLCRQTDKFFNQRQTAFLCMREFLNARQNLPEVLFCTNDNLALGAMEAIQLCGKGGGTVVTGYDGLYHYQSFCRPFNTVRVQFAEMGSLAMNILNSQEEYPSRIEVKPELVLH